MNCYNALYNLICDFVDYGTEQPMVNAFSFEFFEENSNV